ncbi:unnamed protein product [Penicillium glandicola]
MESHPTNDVIKRQMAQLNELVKKIMALNTEMNNAPPHKRLKLCQEIMDKTCQVDALKEHIQYKIETMDIHRKKTLTRQLHEIMNVRGRAIDDNTKTKVATAGTAPRAAQHRNKESMKSKSTLSDDWVLVAEDIDWLI